MRSKRVSILPLLLALASTQAPLPVQAQAPSNGEAAGRSKQSNPGQTSAQAPLIHSATAAVKLMQADPKLRALMAQAKGIFIVPEYTQGGLVLGGRGGQGLLMAQKDRMWVGPVMYTYGGVTVGAQIGGESGEVAMLLMTDKAIDSFMKKNKFSLSAGAGLTVASYDANAEKQAGRGDVVVWMHTGGAYANLSVGVNDVSFDPEANRSLYKQDVNPGDVLGGKVSTPLAMPLQKQLAASQQ